jgi:methionyl aminopeptidase
MTRLKTEREIEILAEGGAILASILDEVRALVQPGVSTGELNDFAAKLMRERKVKPVFFGYHGYPAVLCTSVNSRVVHGIPSMTEILKLGDCIGLDIGIEHRGLITDMAVSVGVGKVSPEVDRIIGTARLALERGIAALEVGRPLGAVGAAVQHFVERQGFGVVRDLTGHGVGHALHEEPSVPNFGAGRGGPKVEVGLVVAIEPMITAGDWHVRTLEDGWTVETLDGSLSAHFEHTVAVTKTGVRILTTTHHVANPGA